MQAHPGPGCYTQVNADPWAIWQEPRCALQQDTGSPAWFRRSTHFGGCSHQPLHLRFRARFLAGARGARPPVQKSKICRETVDVTAAA